MDTLGFCYLGSLRHFLEHHSAKRRSEELLAQTNPYMHGTTISVWRHPTRRSKLTPLNFLKVRDTLKLNGVSIDAILLRLFPFSLRDKGRAWLHLLYLGCITTWDELTKVFLAKFFPPSRMVSLRNQITTFSQKEDKKLSEAWGRFNDLLRLCSHHGPQR